MKFDNAFLTASNKIGMQFRNKGQLFSIYRDKEDKLHHSEGLSDAEKVLLISNYIRLEKIYKH